MKQYSTIKNFVRKYPDFLTEGGIRHLIFWEKQNNFHTCVKRVGRRILLDEDEVFSWVEQQNKAFCSESMPDESIDENLVHLMINTYDS